MSPFHHTVIEICFLLPARRKVCGAAAQHLVGYYKCRSIVAFRETPFPRYVVTARYPSLMASASLLESFTFQREHKGKTIHKKNKNK